MTVSKQIAAEADFDHVAFFDELRSAYHEYLAAAFRFADEDLNHALREHVASSTLVKGPYLEVSKGYEAGDPTAEVFDRALGRAFPNEILEAFTKHPSLYQHQQASLERVSAGQNVVISTGTGSGKTESFLFPILADLFREYQEGTLNKPGVRALVLYPLNALANDQLDRIAEIAEALSAGSHGFNFTFGRYTGETPESEASPGRDRSKPMGPPRAGEVVFREEMRRKPPHILLTNYSMLEYLLLRPKDSGLFDGAHAQSWNFLVIDEVHTYTGTKGTELSFLLRRLKHRLAAEGKTAQMRCIATSATLSTSAEEDQVVAEFMSGLFGEPFEADSIIRGVERPLPTLEEVKEEGTEVLRDPVVGRILALPGHRPRILEEVTDLVGASPLEILEATQRLMTVKDIDSGHPFFSIRYHLLLKQPESLYVSFMPTPAVAFRPIARSGSSWFPTTLCRRCGTHYLEGTIESGRFVEASPDPEGDEDASMTLHLGDSFEGNEGTLHLCLHCGAVDEGTPPICHSNVQPVHRVPHGKSGGPTRCPVCEAQSRRAIQRPRVSPLEAQAFLLQHVHLALPEDRDKVLAFADGRQNAARFAWEASEFSREATYRGILLEELPDLREARLPDLDALFDLLSGGYQNRFVPGGLRRREKTPFLAFLLHELLHQHDPLTLPNMGELAPVVEVPESSVTRLEALVGRPSAELSALVGALALSCLADRAVAMGRLPLNVDWDSLDLPPPQSIVSTPREGRKYVTGWSSDRGRRNDLVRRYLQNVGREGTKEEVDEILRVVFEMLQLEPATDGGSALIADRRGFVLNPEAISFVHRAEMIARCPRCRSYQARTALPVCTSNHCPGIPFPAVRATSPLDRIYRASAAKFLEVEEHTAQIDRRQGQDYQSRFQSNELKALSCSTTFELGVDLGDLDCVFLRNIPPEPFNYTQRVGRVGRRPGFPGIVLAYARKNPHDAYHFDNPDRMLQGELVPPRLTLKNEPILRRHRHAIFLGSWFRQNVERFGKLTEFLGNPDAPDVLDLIRRDLEDKQKKVVDTIVDALGGTRESVLSDLQELVNGGTLHKALAETVGDLSRLRQTEDAAKAASDYREAEWAANRRKTILQEDVLSWLSRNVVIPKYGFPVDVVSLDTQDDSTSRRRVDLDRDLAQAISEYAPDQRVVANKTAWRSVAVKTIPGLELGRRLFAHCTHHGEYNDRSYTSAIDAMDSPIPPCGCTGETVRVGEFVWPRFGFQARPGQESKPIGFQRKVTRTTPIFHRPDGDKNSGRSLDLGNLQIEVADPGRIILISSPADGTEYQICTACGLKRDRGIAGKPHAPPYFRNTKNADCTAEPMTVALGHHFQTTAARLRFEVAETLLPGTTFFAAAIEGLGSLLAMATGEALGVSDQEIGYAWTFREDPARLEVVLYDTAAGGAGLTERLAEEGIVRQMLQFAAQRIEKDCCDVDHSCYSCLRTYRNQFYHARLRRSDVGRLLDAMTVS